MKINLEVDVSPEEARRFFGLPDVAPLQQAMLDRYREQVEMGMDGTLWPNLMRTMVTGGMQSMEAWQEMFAKMMARSAGADGAGPFGDRPGPERK